MRIEELGLDAVFDADSHIMPGPGWLAPYAEGALRDEVAALPKVPPTAAAMIDQQQAALADAMATDPVAATRDAISGPKGWQAPGAIDAGERSRVLDALGITSQFVFSTFVAPWFAKRDDKAYAMARAHNRAMAAFCADDPRLLGVAAVPLHDPARAREEVAHAIELGLRGVQVPSDALTGVAPSHVDHEPIWSLLAEAGVPLLLHIGGGALMPSAYHENGHPKPKDWLGGGENLRSRDLPVIHHTVERFLTCFVLDGVFERHPDLRCGVIEQGATWLATFLRYLEASIDTLGRNEPRLRELTLRPAEYIHRQVRVTPFPFEDVGWLTEQVGNDLLLFSTDYPHIEGGRDPVGRFERSFDAAGIGAEDRRRFYAGNFGHLFPAGVPA